MKRVLSLIAGLTLGTMAQAQVLLTVDISNPANVTVTATGANAAVNDSSAQDFLGFTLIGFLTGDSNALTGVGGTLEADGADGPYDQVFALDYAAGDLSAGPDLNLFVSAGSGTQIFSTSSPAFTGVLAGNLSVFAALLPSSGHSGAIQVGGGPSGSVLGTYTVVPEPSTFLLATATWGISLIFRRRRIR